jgi:putative NADPH-quinone reductase
MSVGKRTDMKTLIVFNHPHEGSYCTSILHAAEKGLKTGGHPCRIINLDKDGFDPVMRSKDLKAFAMAGKDMDDALLEVDPLVMKYKENLEWAEHLVMIFPIWWMTSPAMTKGFIDKVIFPAVAYNMVKGRLVSRLPVRKVTVITTMNTPSDIYKEMFDNSIEGSMIKGTFRQIGIEDVGWISLNGVKQADQEQRIEWLIQVYEYFRGKRSKMASRANRPMING